MLLMVARQVTRAWCVLLFSNLPLLAQNDSGELRLSVADSAGLAISCSIELTSQSNEFHRTYETGTDGKLVAKRLPAGIYRLQALRPGFAVFSKRVEIRSAIPLEIHVTLGLASVETTVVVNDAETLIDPHQTASVNRIGSETLRDRRTASPGRSIVELVNTQPGWLLEANGVLHPRGSEYQTQYIVDGLPLTDNRSPSFAPEIEVEDVQSMSILTAGYPAEYGRKLGGIVEVTTARDARQGFHGKAEAQGGSFDTAGGYLMGQYGWGRNTLSLSGNANRTERYLDPPVEENYTNSGSGAGLTAHYERDLDDNNRLGLIIRREQARFLVPNERLQEDKGQRQDRDSAETYGLFSYQHVFSPNLLGDLRGMVRDLSANFWSNPLATPIVAGQDRGLREAYIKGAVSGHHGAHEWKAGAEADFASIHEAFQYEIIDPSQFDPEAPVSFRFANRAQDREQSLFVQDLLRRGNWTFSAGLRLDHYRLLVDQSALSPRLGAAWYWRKADMVFRASYDRVFQTPASENLLLASSPDVGSLSENVLRLPVQPSLGNFYQAGFAKGFFGKVRVEANWYRRDMSNFADDDLLLNTGVAFPIAFRKAIVHGVEAKLEIPRLGPLSGYLSYSNMSGTGYLPVTGGLFLGSDAAELLSGTSSFPISQDERNYARSRFRYQILPRVWAAAGATYGSGLPVEFSGSREDALDQYGSRIVDRVNFDRGRVRPSFCLDASIGALLVNQEKRTLTLQADVLNLTDRLNVINFSGLFSGTAIAAPRSFALRLTGEF